MNKFIKHRRKAIIVDIDGTLTTNTVHTQFPTTGLQKDIDNFYKSVDFYNSEKIDIYTPVANIVRKYAVGDVIPIFVTAREDTADNKIRSNTYSLIKKVLYCNGVVSDGQLLMREHQDYRTNAEVKRDLYNKFIKNQFEVLFVLEDEQENVEMFQKEGLLVLQVKQGV